MKTLFITISRGSLIRNFFYTGVVGEILRAGIRIVVITPYVGNDVFEKFKHENLIIEPLKATKNKFQGLFTELQKGAIFNKTIRIRFKYRVTGRAPSRILYYVRLFFVAPIRFIPWGEYFIRFLESKINPHTQNDYLFEKYNPDLVFSTAAVNDSYIIKGAKRFGVTSVDMPKSWDNLSKMLFPVKADHLFVWNPFMREQAIKFQGYKEKEISMTGVPQFDFYFQEERLHSREEFCKRFQINPNKKIILYGSTGGNCVDENPYLELLNEYIERGFLPNTHVLVRPHIGHPKDVERFNKVRDLEHITLDETGRQDDSFKDHWDVSEENINGLYNSLYHADVCLNIASTLTLDSIVCNTPVVNINFDTNPNINVHWSTKRLYRSDYIEAIVNTKATYVAEDEKQFKEALKKILVEEKSEKEEEKKELINYLAYKDDGRSGKRVAQKIIKLINRK
tara:strand:- start:1638 stop:2993 length:1356 start_codon:yes stop_codon:yes gene_type:complete